MKKIFEILSKYKNVIDQQDYQKLKKDLKILDSYRNNMSFTNISEVCVKGNFFIHDDYEDFEYFLKNEIKKGGKNYETN